MIWVDGGKGSSQIVNSTYSLRQENFSKSHNELHASTASLSCIALRNTSVTEGRKNMLSLELAHCKYIVRLWMHISYRDFVAIPMICIPMSRDDWIRLFHDKRVQFVDMRWRFIWLQISHSDKCIMRCYCVVSSPSYVPLWGVMLCYVQSVCPRREPVTRPSRWRCVYGNWQTDFWVWVLVRCILCMVCYCMLIGVIG